MPAPPAFASHRPWRGLFSTLLDMAPGLAALPVIWALTPGAGEAGAIETRQIGVLTALGLAGLGGWAGWRAAAVPAALAALALLGLPAGTRSMAAAAVLACGLAAAASGRSASRRETDPALGAWPSVWRSYGLALAVQVLLRPTFLLPLAPDPAHLLELLGFPLGAALAVQRLRRDHGERPALLAAGSVALVGPGFGWHSLLVLAALAAAPELRPERASWRRGLALAALLAVCAIETRWGLLALIAALAAAFPIPLAALALPTLAALASAAVRLRGVEEALPDLGLAFLCIPTWFFAQRAALGVRTGALALALAGLLALPAPASPGAAAAGSPIQALAPALGLVALAAGGWEKSTRFQGAWSTGLLGLAGLLAAFPWLRPAPLDALAQIVDLSAWSAAALAVAAGALALYPWPRWFSRAWPIAVTAALLAHLRPWELRHAGPAATAATAATAGWTTELSGAPGEVSVVSQLANAAQLPRETLVARLWAQGGDGQRRVFPIRAGVETGEWAARRPEIRALEGGRAPASWRSRFTNEGEIGQSYRSRFDLRALPPPVTIEIARDPDLPAAIVFEVFSVAWRP